MKIHRTIWSIICVAAAGAACNAGDQQAQEAPPSVLTTEQQTPDGAPRPGNGGVVRTHELVVGGITVNAEIADTPALRERGLMERDSLPENHGMLFVYPDEQQRSFWMRNTPIALDIAFLDRNGTIINIETMQPNDDTSHYSDGPMMYALEMKAGWFEAHGVEAGDQVQL